MGSDIVSYYKARAKEYEKIYSKPERQDDLLLAGEYLKDTFRDKEVFEIACGTGYWTKIIAKTAKKILATDINETVIEIAKSKEYEPGEVKFRLEDIFQLKNPDKHESLFGGFIWSHINLRDIDHFIEILNSLTQKHGTIVLMDNNYVKESSTPIAWQDKSGNTYQTRMLENGTSYKVLKNFPDENFIRKKLSNKATEIDFINLEYYWILTYKTR